MQIATKDALFTICDERALIFVKKAVSATCCDGRMTYFLVNKNGNTTCTKCDGVKRKEQR